MITKRDLIRNLNKDLSAEYAAMIQYIQHASMLNGPEYFAIIDELLNHAETEHKHAITLTNIIQYLGGIPTVEISPKPQTSLDNKEMLYQDLTWEYEALNNYRERVAQAECLGLYDIGEQLRQIAADEQEHVIDLENALGIPKGEMK